MRLIDAIRERRSVKKFMDKKPDWRKIIRALDAIRFAPKAGNIFPMKFILVKDKEKIKQLADACQQGFVANVGYVVVAVSDDSKLKRSYDERGEKFGRQQAGAAIQNFLLALTEQKLATCWVGHFVEEQVKRTLEIPESSDYVVEALFPIGKESKSMAQTKERDKPDLENHLYFDKWDNQYMEPLTRVSDMDE